MKIDIEKLMESTICCHDQIELDLENAFIMPMKDILESKTFLTEEVSGKKRGFDFRHYCT
jgi:hypothetical protein